MLAAKEAWQRKRQTPLFFKQEEKEKSHHPNAASARASAQGRVQPEVPAKDVADNANAEILRKPKEVRNEEAERPQGSRQRKQEKREEAKSQQRPTKDQQLNLCEDGQCERLQDASTIAYKKNYINERTYQQLKVHHRIKI